MTRRQIVADLGLTGTDPLRSNGASWMPRLIKLGLITTTIIIRSGRAIRLYSLTEAAKATDDRGRAASAAGLERLAGRLRMASEA